MRSDVGPPEEVVPGSAVVIKAWNSACSVSILVGRKIGLDGRGSRSTLNSLPTGSQSNCVGHPTYTYTYTSIYTYTNTYIMIYKRLLPRFGSVVFYIDNQHQSSSSSASPPSPPPPPPPPSSSPSSPPSSSSPPSPEPMTFKATCAAFADA